MPKSAVRLAVVVLLIALTPAGAGAASRPCDCTRPECAARLDRRTQRRCDGAARATELVALGGNLSSDTAVVANGFDGTSFPSAFATSSFVSSIEVHDSLGGSHDLLAFFTHTGAGAWAVHLGVDLGGTGVLTIVGDGALTFGSRGQARGPAKVTADVTFPGAEPQRLTLHLRSGLTQGLSPTGLSCVYQDGCELH